MYSSSLGRFLQRDPAGYVPGPNEYEIDGSNPVARVDPTGLDWVVTIPLNNGGSYQTGTNIYTPGPGPDPGLAAMAARKAMLDAWAAQQKTLLANAINSIGPKGNYSTPFCTKCTPEMRKVQAQEIANAIVDAVYNYRLARGVDQPSGVAGNLCPGTKGCGDWMPFVANAANTVIQKHESAKDSCYALHNFDGTGGTHAGVRQHHWAGISIGGNVLPIDPWPTGGTGNLDDPSATTVWPNIVDQGPAWGITPIP